MVKQYKGLGVSQGRALGYIHIYEENNHLIDNRPEILVVKSLNRQIVTTLAHNIVGVIAETGSIGSHGSGILRELGIPCVLRIDSAKNIFHEGQIVEVDGNSSKIVVMKETIIDSQNNKNIVPIQISQEKECYRPERLYQKLRFDILESIQKEIHAIFFCHHSFLTFYLILVLTQKSYTFLLLLFCPTF